MVAERRPSAAVLHVHVVDLHLVPGYRPELNPDELINADMKRNVNASRAHNVDRLTHETRRFLRRRRRQPHIVRSYFQAPHVRYTAT
ncbi:hypothetical protein ADK67_40110 [Saccharothrix sp. NRRL B-16348]|uniref:hypothetical protein n=1 Tax=Saccharothrix sp. NRRL B-16348 TaxID=1415542 RepID=UPI0006AE6E5D|nr:hypothetical protein [Saccharothrix sp. NRRL B-16348]KOX16366.1 hypothetical protein ADK67_40110 [Saccharothrix sp. NRRL B-16348]